MAEYLSPGRFIDSGHPDVIAFAQDACGTTKAATKQAERLYYAVRDRVAYDPYVAYGRVETYRASACLNAGRGYCVAKAALLAAAGRVVGIPSRIGLADVRNHLATRRLLELIGTDVFLYHGYTELYLDGRWVKATPTFNIELCERFGVRPLDFDGTADALFHPFDRQGRRHMEYLKDHGAFADVPADEIMDMFRRNYPKLFEAPTGTASFEREASDERQR